MVRKQPLYFLNTRDEVVSVFRGVIDSDFKYFKDQEELESLLEENSKQRVLENEDSHLLIDNGNQEEIYGWKNSVVELREISCGDKEQSIICRKISS